MSILNKYRNELESLNVALPFMEGREKTECKEYAKKLNGEVVHINNLGFMELPNEQTGELQKVAVITIQEDDKNFIFVGQAVTDTLIRISDMVGDDLEALLEEGIPVIFEIRKSKNKREYVSMKIAEF